MKIILLLSLLFICTTSCGDIEGTRYGDVLAGFVTYKELTGAERAYKERNARSGQSFRRVRLSDPDTTVNVFFDQYTEEGRYVGALEIDGVFQALYPNIRHKKE